MSSVAAMFTSNAVPFRGSWAWVAGCVTVAGGMTAAAVASPHPAWVAGAALYTACAAVEVRRLRFWRVNRELAAVSDELRSLVWQMELFPAMTYRDTDGAVVFMLVKDNFGNRFLYRTTDDELIEAGRALDVGDRTTMRMDLFGIPPLRSLPVTLTPQHSDVQLDGNGQIFEWPAGQHRSRVGRIRAAWQLRRSGYLYPSLDELREAVAQLRRAQPVPADLGPA